MAARNVYYLGRPNGRCRQPNSTRSVPETMMAPATTERPSRWTEAPALSVESKSVAVETVRNNFRRRFESIREDWYDEGVDKEETAEQDAYVDFDFDFFSILSKPKNYYESLEVKFNATEDSIRSNFIRLALQWHLDKRKDEDSATSRFLEINEAYKVLSDPIKRREYDRTLYADDYNIVEYLNQYKGLILTCNGLGIRHSI
ncbi:hypothetical protein NE237_023184 [Protea cynaroides]|uniref:J domain-containing protein n=1 Tax=Protea cynaroides TaxID=273540 RepID=A0A9Q0K5Y6_9MAGN|nr:hypothetical protein NE237_023184 [Protea cynaroides]